MNDQTDRNDLRPPAPDEMYSDARELLRGWEFLPLVFPDVRFGAAGLAISVSSTERRLSFGPRLRVRVLRRSRVSDAVGY